MTQESGQQGSDPVGDFQRWLLRSGARSFSREVRGNLRKTFGYGDAGRDDVWESATKEPEGGEPPECEWCPLCRAARKFRESGPGLGSHLSSAGDIFATVVQDAVDVFEAALAMRPASSEPRGDRETATCGTASAPDAETAAAGHEQEAGDSPEGPADGPDDRS
ncbi:MAG: hypothetical protein ABSA03_04940 [Streptosporangiaceae bacterium]